MAYQECDVEVVTIQRPGRTTTIYRNRRTAPRRRADTESTFGVPAFIGSDRRIFQKAGMDDGFGTDEVGRQFAREKAAAAGLDVTGAVFFPSLCREGEPFDINAWCWDSSDIKNRAEANGQTVDFGGTCYKGPVIEEPDDKPYEVDPQLIDDEVGGIVIEKHGGEVSKQVYDDLYDQVKRKRSCAD